MIKELQAIILNNLLCFFLVVYFIGLEKMRFEIYHKNKNKKVSDSPPFPR
jgi:hypothetical protein